MSSEIPEAGSIDAELARKAIKWWIEAAEKHLIETVGLDLDAPLEEQIAWALSIGLSIGTIYARYSSEQRHSIADQVRESVVGAALRKIFVPPALISCDETVKRKKVRRDGLERMRFFLKSRLATVLLVFKVSRLFRHACEGYQLFQEEVVEGNLRGISVSQGIDTDDRKSWKVHMWLHGIV